MLKAITSIRLLKLSVINLKAKSKKYRKVCSD